MQSINERLFLNLPLIERNYNGRVLLRTYVSVIIKNICLRINKERTKDIKTIPNTIREPQAAYVHDPANALIIQEELERFRAILQIFPAEREKLYVCMKLYFKIPLLPLDIFNWSRNIVYVNHREYLLSMFGGNYQHMTAEEIFTAFAPVMRSYENKKVNGKTLYFWTNEQVNAFIKMLNGNPPRRTHTKETLHLLLNEEYEQTSKQTKFF